MGAAETIITMNRFKFLFSILSLIVAQTGAEEFLLHQDRWNEVGQFKTSVETKNFMPGNDSFGFFYRANDETKGVCRIRAKFICDYGMRIEKELKNRSVLLIVHRQTFNTKTDRNGLLDALFRCDKDWQNSQASLMIGGYSTKFALKDAAKEHRIPEKQCD